MLHVTVETFMLRHSRTVIYEPLNSLIGYSVLTGGVVNRVRGIYVLPAGVVRCQSQVVLHQTADSWANAGVLLGARMHRISHGSGAGELSKQLHFRRYALCCFPTNSHAIIVPIFARRYDVDIRRFERQRLKYTFALFRSHFEYHN